VETLQLLVGGIETAAHWNTLAATLFGVVVGLLIGALPGLGPSAGVAIMLPVVVGLGGVPALACLAGVYYGAMFGGAVTSILLGIPGDPTSVMTVLDGYPMAKKGQAGQALGMSVFASFVGGIVGLLGLAYLSVPIADAALVFGPVEMTALMVFTLSLVSILGGRNPVKGATALAIGFALGTIGLDPIAGPIRFTFGSLDLFEGLDFTLVAVGLFGLTAMFTDLDAKVDRGTASFTLAGLMPRLSDAVKARWELLQGSVTGFVVGVLPGIGATAATMMSYALAKRFSKTPELFGTGIPEGVAAPEAANNSASYGNMITLFTLGIPSSSTTAVMMGGLLMLGLQPGPLLFANNGDFIWAVFGSFWIGNLMLVFLTILLTPALAAILYVTTAILYPIVFAIIVYGVFAIDNSIAGVTIALAAGAFGLVLIKLDYPPVPLVLGLMLGPLLERNIRRTLISSRGDAWVFLSHPISMGLFIATALVLLIPLIMRLLHVERIKADEEAI
jgi:putative tricarboxylic transport membrane protein